mmetsp:Transcript_73462/g.175078  ORF Transcript_73462/g.175078 Transcript_73462/m.175078 type:complete len:826 (+) Transcript_73462:156-2633(+)|eukprot:CAMPEP_0178394764 /NCGR_PEP_ID=MMETSP0689_2-20121128/12874_1 /TAXON_ID=160604 /ORGANISM="Amphidinium massartii, Strain CS-259" /LENGTH=825 /DNA_ID=CAMNT_0020015403 /DNA_START=39 /DNA_END=2516 /DNA_ORIENTATION=+
MSEEAATRFLHLLQRVGWEYDLLRLENERLQAQERTRPATTEKRVSRWRLQFGADRHVVLTERPFVEAAQDPPEIIDAPASVSDSLAPKPAVADGGRCGVTAAILLSQSQSSSPKLAAGPPTNSAEISEASPRSALSGATPRLPKRERRLQFNNVGTEADDGADLARATSSKEDNNAIPMTFVSTDNSQSQCGGRVTPITVISPHQSEEVPPTVFQLKVAWRQTPQPTGIWGQEVDEEMVRMQAAAMKLGRSRQTTYSRSTTGTRGTFAALVWSRYVFHPRDRLRLHWDLLGLMAIFYDVITLPLQAFELDEDLFSVVMQWVTLLFWTCDVPMSLRTGFYAKGEVVMETSAILVNYIKTWFLPDMVILIPDWVLTVQGDSQTGRLTRVLRSSRAVRMIRLLRLVKLRRFVRMIYDSIDSEYSFVILQLMQLLCSIMIMNHYTACGWYLIGRIAQDQGEAVTWLEDTGRMPVADGTVPYKYTTALHWSLTQFTPASMDVFATNLLERIYSIVILFFALVAFSSVIGSITASMTSIRNIKSDEMRNFWMLRRYLRQQQISQATSDRVMKYMEHKVETSRKRVNPTKVSFLEQLSEHLRLDLINEMSAPLLEEHPFFRHINEEIHMIMYRLCSQALLVTQYAVGDDAFEAGEWANSMYFVKAGRFRYEITGSRLSLEAGMWVSEAVLWTIWRHLGLFRATRPGELIAVNPDIFAEILRTHPKPWYFAQHYGENFVAFINEVIDPGALSDVIFSEEFFGALEACIRQAKEAVLLRQRSAAATSSGRFTGALGRSHSRRTMSRSTRTRSFNSELDTSDGASIGSPRPPAH